ncbi:MAG TPA: hypothetical protein VFV87_03735 [Pirellulaceae bacterium]|nr:hypothetical protein [Pirellulaceae bacterium]
MRYRLRTLLIFMALAPPLLAVIWQFLPALTSPAEVAVVVALAVSFTFGLSLGLGIEAIVGLVNKSGTRSKP